MFRILAILALALAGASQPAFAKTHEGHGAHHPAVQQDKAVAKLPSVKAYMQASDAMHAAMDICYTGDADVDFAAGMIPHHQGAIDMAKVQLQYGADEDLKILARRIITWQEYEIGMMRQWLAGRQSGWVADKLSERASVRAYKDAMQRMHAGMDIRYSGNADRDFALGMIPHHQGAIDMAWVLKAHGKDPMLRRLADDVIRTQAQEIELMESWLAAHPAAKPSAIKKKKITRHDHTSH